MKKSITSQTYNKALFYMLCGVMVFLLTLSVNTLFVSAEGSNSLPYIVDNSINVNDFASLYNGHPFQTTYTLPISDDNSFFFEFTYNNLTYYYVYVPRQVQAPTRSSDPYKFYVSYLSVPYDAFDTSINSANIAVQNYAVAQFVIDGNGNLVFNNIYLSENITYGLSIFSNSIYTPVYICREVLDSSDNVVLGFASNEVDITGHAQPPVDDNGHYIEDGNGNRIPKPNKPTPNVYTPPTIQFPSVDTSSLEKLIESLIDLVQYGISYIGGVINGSISNLLSNLDLWFDYLVSSFNYGINNIVGAIKDLAQTFYNNMVSLFEPIYVFFSGVANFFNSLIELGMVDGQFVFSTFVSKLVVPDVSDVVDLLIDHDAFGSHALFLASYHKIQFLINTFSSLQPIKVFTVPSTTWHGYTIGGFAVDFSWYDNFKVYMDLILSGFLIIGYLYWLFSSLNSLFRGTGSMVYDSLYEPSTKGGEHH